MLTAREIGQLAERLASDYLAFLALMESATHPDSLLRVPSPEVDHLVGAGSVPRKDGSVHHYHYQHFLAQGLQSDKEELSRIWLSGALIALGDALEEAAYFDRAPELELVRHLRNAVAHRNRFHFKHGEPRRPAHNLFALVRGWYGDSEFAIDSSLQGRECLFDLMGPGDLLDVFISVGNYLLRMANGDYPRRSWLHAPDLP